MKRGKKRCAPCNNKVGFPSQERAQMAALRLARTAGKSWRAYECPHGTGWHLTTTHRAAA